MSIARDRLKLADFVPLPDELEVARKLDSLTGRFAIDASGRIVKLYIREKLTDEHTHLVLALSGLKFFTTFDVSGSDSAISDAGMADLVSHPCLVDIIHQGNGRLTGKFFQAFAAASTVKRIAVPYCPVNDAGLALARDCLLTHISLRGSRISDASVDTLCSMRSLVQMHVKQTLVSHAGLERLRQALPDCWIDAIDRPNDG